MESQTAAYAALAAAIATAGMAWCAKRIAEKWLVREMRLGLERLLGRTAVPKMTCYEVKCSCGEGVFETVGVMSYGLDAAYRAAEKSLREGKHYAAPIAVSAKVVEAI